MPKILSYTPAWLSRPSQGFNLFVSDGKKLSGNRDGHPLKKSTNGVRREVEDKSRPHRTIARRGTEIFVAVGNTIRWADLCMLKDDWESQERNLKWVSKSIEDSKSEDRSSNETCFRVLKAPVYEQIHQLSLSPNGDYLAIVTSHTVHIAILPHSSHLDQPDTGPIRLKTHTLGPTTHVLSQSPVVKALWHPLGAGGNCVVTITKDAAVRVWELNRENRWSFDSPTLAFDLKKLHHANSAEDDISVAKIGTNRGFSIDALEMEVVSACFGGMGSEAESGWCSMTLWLAMAEGDVYALCPLLPSKWQPHSSLIPTLTTSVVAQKEYLEQDDAPAEHLKYCDEQYQWLAEIDRQDPVIAGGKYETSDEVAIYDRPLDFGPIPSLQGPFTIIPDDLEDLEDEPELSDIYVIGSKLDSEEVPTIEDDEEEQVEASTNGLSIAVVCILSRSGHVYVCLDLDGVEARWLPKKKPRSRHKQEPISQPELTLLEVIETCGRRQDSSNVGWPSFTPDALSSYSFFVTHNAGIYLLSLEPWLESLESELRSTASEGAEFRLDVLTTSASTIRQRILGPQRSDADDNTEHVLAVPIVLQDSDLGYFLLTTNGEQPQAVILDSPQSAIVQALDHDSLHDYEPDLKLLTQGPARSAYQPPQTLWAESSLPTFIDTHIPARYKKTLKEEIRLSTATLDVMTSAHRILSAETHRLGVAAADLFRRCERLQEEFRDQIRRANEVATRIEGLNGEDADDYGDRPQARGSARIDERLEAAKKRQVDLISRHEQLRRRLVRAGGRQLSDKERAWVAEVKRLAASIPATAEESKEDEDATPKSELLARYDEARTLADHLVAQTTEAAKGGDGTATANGAFKVPPDIRKHKVAHVMGLLERETALVDAAQERLERLTLAALT